MVFKFVSYAKQFKRFMPDLTNKILYRRLKNYVIARSPKKKSNQRDIFELIEVPRDPKFLSLKK